MPKTRLRVTPLTDDEISLLLSGKKLATEDEAAYVLNITKGHLRKLRYAKKIPTIVLGQFSPRFSLPKVLAALQKFERKEVA